MDEEDKQRRLERRRRAVALLRAMHEKDDARVEELITALAADDDLKRVLGALAVAGSTLADNVAKTRKMKIEEVFAELEQVMVSAPVE